VKRRELTCAAIRSCSALASPPAVRLPSWPRIVVVATVAASPAHARPAVIVAVLIPVLLRRIFAADLADAAQDPASSPSSDLPPTSRVSLDLESGGRLGTPRELLDGTTRSSTDGSARVRTYEDRDCEDSAEEGDGEDEVRKALLAR
jgi:hypothetical protein